MSTGQPHVELPDPAQVELFRRMRPAERVASALRMTRLVRTMTETRLRRDHPDMSGEQIARELRQLLHGRRG